MLLAEVKTSTNSKCISGTLASATFQYSPTRALPLSVPEGSCMNLAIYGVVISKSSV
jgi:hypothetical protein